jgi:hypothetical protein
MIAVSAALRASFVIGVNYSLDFLSYKEEYRSRNHWTATRLAGRLAVDKRTFIGIDINGPATSGEQLRVASSVSNFLGFISGVGPFGVKELADLCENHAWILPFLGIGFRGMTCNVNQQQSPRTCILPGRA